MPLANIFTLNNLLYYVFPGIVGASAGVAIGMSKLTTPFHEWRHIATATHSCRKHYHGNDIGLMLEYNFSIPQGTDKRVKGRSNVRYMEYLSIHRSEAKSYRSQIRLIAFVGSPLEFIAWATIAVIIGIILFCYAPVGSISSCVLCPFFFMFAFAALSKEPFSTSDWHRMLHPEKFEYTYTEPDK